MMEGLHVFLFFQLPGKKGFKFHAQPQTGAYSCLVFTQFTKVVMNQSIMLMMLHAVSLDKLSIKIVLKEGRGSQLSDRHKPATVKNIDSV